MRTCLALFTLVLMVSGCQGPSVKEGPDPVPVDGVPPVRFERLDRDLPVDASLRQVVIVNRHGSVALKQTKAATVGLHQVVQRIGVNPEAPIIRFERRGDKILLDVSYVSDVTVGADTLVNGFRKGRVDTTVFVPKNVEVTVETTYGAIQARRIDNDLLARSTSGRIMAAGGGAMTLTSETGIVRAFPTAQKWSRPLTIDTDSGDVLVEVVSDTSMRIEAQTRGALRVFGSPIPGEPAAEKRYEAGDGTPQQTLKINSRSGTIELVEVPNGG